MMPLKWMKTTGWILSGLLAVVFIGSAVAKLSGSAMIVKQFGELGLSNQVRLIGIGELTSAILFLIPLTHPLGVLLLSSYMGGAILAHMSHGKPYVLQSMFLVLIWTAGFLRRPQLFLDVPKAKFSPVVEV